MHAPALALRAMYLLLLARQLQPLISGKIFGSHVPRYHKLLDERWYGFPNVPHIGILPQPVLFCLTDRIMCVCQTTFDDEPQASVHFGGTVSGVVISKEALEVNCEFV